MADAGWVVTSDIFILKIIYNFVFYEKFSFLFFSISYSTFHYDETTTIKHQLSSIYYQVITMQIIQFMKRIYGSCNYKALNVKFSYLYDIIKNEFSLEGALVFSD